MSLLGVTVADCCTTGGIVSTAVPYEFDCPRSGVPSEAVESTSLYCFMSFTVLHQSFNPFLLLLRFQLLFS